MKRKHLSSRQNSVREKALGRPGTECSRQRTAVHRQAGGNDLCELEGQVRVAGAKETEVGRRNAVGLPSAPKVVMFSVQIWTSLIAL